MAHSGTDEGLGERSAPRLGAYREERTEANFEGETVMIRVRRLAAAATALSALAASALLLAPTAQASLLSRVVNQVVNLNTCNSNALTQPFLPWADPASYELAPDGTFGDGSWSLNGGASLVPGGEPWAVTGTQSSSALSLPAGSSADSPSTCVTAAYPTIRFFVSGVGEVGVNVVYNGVVIPSGVVVAAGNWVPGPVAITGSAITGALNGGTANVSLRLTGVAGDPQVSDVFIDPRGRY